MFRLNCRWITTRADHRGRMFLLLSVRVNR